MKWIFKTVPIISRKSSNLKDRIAILETREKLLVQENNNLRAAIRAAKNILEKTHEW